MTRERRLVGRTTTLVDAELRWETKRLVAGTKSHNVNVTTLNISVAGAELLAHTKAPLPPGASCLLIIDGVSSAARVKGVTVNDSGRQILHVQFENASDEFHARIEDWLDSEAGGPKFGGRKAA